MRKTLLAVALLVSASPAFAQFCSNCILNSAAPQVAQFNVGTGTVRGMFTASTGTFTHLYATNLTITNLAGNGALLTALNASQLTSGTVPAARMSGAYTGITQVGTLTGGVWNGTLIGPAYGGTGANLSISGTAGGLPYFSGSGVQGVIASPAGQRVLATAGSGATPAWTTAPTIVGTNFSAIPLTALSNGTLQAGIQVPNASLVSIDAAKVQGNIAGGADFLTTPLPISDLAPGTLPTTNAASSVTASGVTAGTFGGPTTLAQFRVGDDGRLYDAKQFNLVFYSTAMVPGRLPAGVTLPASQVSSGTLAGDVIASSVAATAVTAGSYGSASRTITLTVGVDGRLTAVAQPSIALPLSQLNNGTLPSGVKLPAASVNAGSLGATVIASSVAANGVTPGVYGSATVTPQLTIGADGRVTSATQFSIPGVSTRTAFIDQNNQWHGPTQISDAAWYFGAQTTVAGPLVVTGASGIMNTYGVTSGSFTGRGDDITHLTPENFDAGVLPADVIASSVAVRKVGDLQLTLSGVTAGSKGSAARVPVVTVDAQGRLTSLTDVGIALSTGEVSGIVQTAQGGTGNNWSATAANGIPYFSGAGTLGVLPTGTGVLQTASGAPAYTLVPTLTATNITGVSGVTGLGTQAQILNMGSHRITNVTDPSSDQDAATKFYVDSIASGIQWKAAARLATTAALAANSYSNGSSGVGATLTGLGIGALTIDGVTVVVGNRVLIKDEVAGSHNGIYTVTQTGAGVVYILTRATDYDTATEMDYGTALFITAGTVNADSGFVQINSIATVGTDALSFTQFTGLGEVTAGNGLQKSANTISLISPVTTTNGGTGADWSAVTVGRIPYFSGTGALSTLAAGTANNVLVSGGAGAPSWSGAPTILGTNITAIPAATALTGQVPIANGGTNLSSAGGTANRVLRTSDGTTFVMGQVIGPDIAASTIPASAINQSGAATTNVLAWNGSIWAPAAAASVTRSYEVTLASKAMDGITYALGSFANSMSGNCSNSTMTWTADGISTYTISGMGSYSVDFGVNVAWGYLLDGAIPNSRQGTALGLCGIQSIAGELRTCPFTDNISPASGTHQVCLRAGESSNGETITFGGATTLKSNYTFKVTRWATAP
jgi:hypothetical protein